MNSRHPAAVHGFTMVEVLVVLVVVAILAALVAPSFSQQIARARRSAAEAYLLEAASRQERFLLDRRGYAADPDTLGLPAPGDVGPHYTIAFEVDNAATPPTYTLSATPIGSQLERDSRCKTLSIDSTGVKLASGESTPGAHRCWG